MGVPQNSPFHWGLLAFEPQPWRSLGLRTPAVVQRNGGSGHIAGHAAGDGGLWPGDPGIRAARCWDQTQTKGICGCFLGEKMGDEPAKWDILVENSWDNQPTVYILDLSENG